MTILFWDIDGTLLLTGGAGIAAWDDACRAIIGRPFDPGWFKTDGLTDHLIAVRTLESTGTDPSRLDDLVRHYESRLPVQLPMRQGSVLDGVREILTHLRASRPDVHSMLLTGNTPAGARAKLAHYGLQEFFDGGAFSEDTGPRSGIAARALVLAWNRFPQTAGERRRMFVLGDTAHDIDCARAIGVPTIAIASSSAYNAQTLAAHGAWRVFDRLPDPAAFESLIDGPVEPVSSGR